MCGIVGLFIKNPAMEKSLGEHLSNMLIEMTERGPDSSGIAIYDGGATEGTVRITVLSTDPDYSWESFKEEVRAVFGASSKIEMNSNHAVLIIQAEAKVVQSWLHQKHPGCTVVHSSRIWACCVSRRPSSCAVCGRVVFRKRQV